jgi:hypothetical protein
MGEVDEGMPGGRNGGINGCGGNGRAQRPCERPRTTRLLTPASVQNGDFPPPRESERLEVAADIPIGAGDNEAARRVQRRQLRHPAHRFDMLAPVATSRSTRLLLGMTLVQALRCKARNGLIEETVQLSQQRLFGIPFGRDLAGEE